MFRPLCLLLGLLPALCGAEPTSLRVQGSNTVGSVLGPALVRGLLQAKGAHAIETLPGAQPNEVWVQGITALGQTLRVSIAAHGSSTGFAALKSGDADLAAT